MNPDNLKAHAIHNPIVFRRVREAYGWCSNMSPHPVTDAGVSYRTSEALFQALRFEAHPEVQAAIRAATSPMGAKMAAKSNTDLMGDRTDPAWIVADLDRMRHTLRVKLACHPQLATDLRATGDRTIIEDVSARPQGSGIFWGMARTPEGLWYGQNWLGALWAELRATL